MNPARRRFRIALVLLLAGAPAWGPAQVLDEVFPPGVPGYNATPGVTVLSRLHPNYASRGVAYSGLTFLPGLDLGAGYDSNPNGVAPASAVATAAPSLRVVDPALGLGAYASGVFNRYAGAAAQDTSNLTTGIGLDLPFGANSLTMGAAHLVVDETSLGIGTAALAAPVQATVNDIRAKADFSSGMIEVTPGLGATGERFAGSLPQANENRTSPLSNEDRTVLHQSLGLTARPRGILDYTLLLRADEADYASPAASPNSMTSEALAGIATDTGGLWRLRLLAGLAHQGFADPATPSHTTPVAELGLGWMPDALTAIDLTVTRRVDLTAAAGALASTQTTGELAIAEEYQRNLVLTAGTSLQESHGQSGGVQADQHVFDARAGFVWHLSRALSVAGTYRFETTSGTLTQPAHDNLIHMALEWTP